jgi:hypothetical protein
MRANKLSSESLVSKYLSQYQGTEPVTLTLLQRTAINQLFNAGAADWTHWLEVVARSYDQGTLWEPNIAYYSEASRRDTSIPLEVAHHIADYPERFPRQLVSVAEARCKLEVNSNVVPVAEIAEKDEWFSMGASAVSRI